MSCEFCLCDKLCEVSQGVGLHSVTYSNLLSHGHSADSCMLTLGQMPQALIAGSKQLRFYTGVARGTTFPFSGPEPAPPPPGPALPAAPKPQRAHKAQVSAVLTHAALLLPS